MIACKTAASGRRLDEALNQGFFPAGDPAALTELADDACDAPGAAAPARPNLPRIRSRRPRPTTAAVGHEARWWRPDMRRAFEAAVQIPAPAEAVFARLDDQTWLAARMERSSAMMGGSSFGLSLYVNEVVTVRDPPRRRAWKTVGAPRLLVVGAYEMGLKSRLRPPARTSASGSPTTLRWVCSRRRWVRSWRRFTPNGAWAGWRAMLLTISANQV
jgi:hypothetical protein